jgi:hypothetical protein
MQTNPNQTNQKDPDNRGLDEQNVVSEQLRTLWSRIKNDYRSLVGLKGVSVVSLYADINEEGNGNARCSYNC